MCAATQVKISPSWENRGLNCLILGLVLIIIGILTQILEFPRVYNDAANVNPIDNNADDLYFISNYYNHWWP